MRKLLFAVCLSVIPAVAADVYTFTVPAGENVSGPAGLTLTGWGYSLHNDSSSLWLVPTGISVGTFLHATPDLLFDFPDVSPGATATELYNPVTPSGLYQFFGMRTRRDSSTRARSTSARNGGMETRQGVAATWFRLRRARANRIRRVLAPLPRQRQRGWPY